MKTIFKLAIAIGFVTTIAACNTLEGAGKDIEEAGETVQDVAD